MPTLKVRCPGCDANIRHSADEAADEVSVVCPKCGNQFTAEVERERPTKVAKRPAKASRRDEEDAAPRGRRKNAAAGGPNQTLIVGAVAGGVLLVVGVVVAVVSIGGKDTARTDPPPGQFAPAPPPGPLPGTGNGNGTPVPPRPGPGTNPSPPPKKPDTPPPPKKDPPGRDPEDDDPPLPPGFKLPDPPVIRINGSAVPPAAPLARPPASPPLPPEEDPFERAKTFRAEGPPPKPPALPPVAQRPVLVLDSRGHTGMIRGVFLTPDAAKLVTVSEDKSVRVWDAASGEVLHTVRFPGIPGGIGTLYAAALSPDGRRLAVGGVPLGDGKDGIPVYFVSVATGKLEKAVFGMRQTPFTAAFTPDGRRLAVGCMDGTIQMIDVLSGKVVGETRQHKGNVRAIRFAAKGGRMASTAADRILRIWEPAGNKSTAIPLPDLGPAAMDWSPDGQTLAVGGASGAIVLFGPDGREKKTIPGIQDRGVAVQVIRLAFTPDGKEIVWGGIGRTGHAGVITLDTGERRVAFPHHTNTVGAVTVSRDGKLAATMGGNNEEVYLWRVADGGVVRKFVGGGEAIFGVRWGIDGKSIAFGTENRSDADGVHGVQHTFRLDEFGFGGPPDPAKYLRPRFSSGEVRLVRKGRGALDVVQNGQLLRSFKFEDNLLDAASLVPGRGLLISSGPNLDLVDPRDGKVLRRYDGHTGPVFGLAMAPDDRHFVTGSVDRTVRLWSVDREEPLLSLFFVGREWIAWTPEGYYACSPYGEQLIAWQVNAGVAKLPTTFPAARFRASMYQPALLKYLIPAGNVPTAMAMARKFDAALVRAANVADVLPPEVTLVAPAAEDGAVIDQEKVTVKATARGSAKQPVVAMRLLVDGRPFGGADGVRRFDKPAATAEATWEVPIAQGPHWFAVIAESSVSKGMSRVAAVTRPGEPPKPNLYVLAMGVSDYPGDEMDLRYAASDAKLLAKTFQTKSKGVFNDIEVRVLADADATSKNIRAEMDWLKSKMTPADVAVVAFSGHGTRDPRGQFYLVTADEFEGDPRRAWLPGDEFKTRLENMPGRVVAILDACHSGAVADRPRQQSGADGLVRDLVSEETGVVVMCSSLGREYSLESPLTKAGLYTLGLVEGMSGHGDVDQDGVVYIHELDLYSNVRVRQLSGGRQNPTVGRPPGVRPFPIARP